MREIAMRYSGGKESTLAALFAAREYDSVHLLTFKQEMVCGIENSKLNVPKLERAVSTAVKYNHVIIDIDHLVRKFYYGKGYFHDVCHYGTLARACLCTACDFAMYVRVIQYCTEHDIHVACDGGNRGEFAGFLDEWALDTIQSFVKKYQIEWIFPVYDNSRCDITLFKEGLRSQNPTIFFRNQASCRGGGLFANIYLRCYFLPLYGAKRYEELTLKWLRERIEMANLYLTSFK